MNEYQEPLLGELQDGILKRKASFGLVGLKFRKKIRYRIERLLTLLFVEFSKTTGKGASQNAHLLCAGLVTL